MQDTIHLSIPSARLAPEAKSYSLYDITIKHPMRTLTIPKRYSEFVQLQRHLITQAGQAPPSPLPPKHYFSSTARNLDLMEQRRVGLEAYLQAINTAADSRWRNTAAWTAFLNLTPVNPSLSTAPTTQTGSSSRAVQSVSSDPMAWLDGHRQLKTELREARSLITARAGPDGGSVSQESRAAAKSVLIKTGNQLNELDKALARVQEDGGREKLGEGELRRRRDMLAAARKEKEDLESLLLAMAQKKDLDDVVGRNQNLLTGAQETAGHGRKPPVAGLGKGRVLGQETSKTRELDNSGILDLQKQTMQEQDEDVNMIADAVRRQKQLAIQINEELAVQNEMLSFLDEDTTRVDAKMNLAKKKLGKIR